MAKKKRTPARRTHHRHHRGRIGATHHGMHFNLMDTLESGAGLVIGGMVGTAIQKHLTQFPQKLISVGQLVLGIMNTGRPNKIMAGAAWGLAGAGAIGLAHETGLLHGVDEMVSGMFNQDTLSGGGYEMHNYEPNGQLEGMGNDTVLSGMANGVTLGEAGEAMQDQLYVPVMGYGNGM